MARSSYVYVVIEQRGERGDRPVAGFTVKHELKSWLQRIAEQSPMNPVFACLSVYRVPDGKGVREAEMWGYMGTARSVLDG